MAASILLRVRNWGHLEPSRKCARVPGSTPARLANASRPPESAARVPGSPPARLANASRPSEATSRLTARLASSRLMTLPCDLGGSTYLTEDHCRPAWAACRSPGLMHPMPPARGGPVDGGPIADRELVNSQLFR